MATFYLEDLSSLQPAAGPVAPAEGSGVKTSEETVAAPLRRRASLGAGFDAAHRRELAAALTIKPHHGEEGFSGIDHSRAKVARSKTWYLGSAASQGGPVGAWAEGMAAARRRSLAAAVAIRPQHSEGAPSDADPARARVNRSRSWYLGGAARQVGEDLGEHLGLWARLRQWRHEEGGETAQRPPSLRGAFATVGGARALQPILESTATHPGRPDERASSRDMFPSIPRRQSSADASDSAGPPWDASKGAKSRRIVLGGSLVGGSAVGPGERMAFATPLEEMAAGIKG